MCLSAGQGMAESAPFERGGGTEQQQVQLAERQLLPVHEHIIVGLPPFWAVTSPDAAALRAHFFLRVRGVLSSPVPSAWCLSHQILPAFERLKDLVALFPPCAKGLLQGDASRASELSGATGHVRDACLWAGVPGALPDCRPPGALCCWADHAHEARPGSLFISVPFNMERLSCYNNNQEKWDDLRL